MSERSVYLRDQACKCRRHADALSDIQTQAALRKLASEYDIQAEALERTQADGPERDAVPVVSEAASVGGPWP